MGIVKNLEHAYKNQARYLAGIWDEVPRLGPPLARYSLLLGTLVWEVSAPQPKPAHARAPSWSWIAVDGHVRFCFDEMNLPQWESSLADVERINATRNISWGLSGELFLKGCPTKLATLRRAVGKKRFAQDITFAWDYAEAEAEAKAAQPHLLSLARMTPLRGGRPQIYGLVLTRAKKGPFTRHGSFHAKEWICGFLGEKEENILII